MGGSFWTKKIQFKVIIVLPKTQKLRKLRRNPSFFYWKIILRKSAICYYYYYYFLFISGIFSIMTTHLTHYLSRVYQNPRNEI